MPSDTVEISFPGDKALAGKLAGDLAAHLSAVVDGVDTELRRTDADAMDMGTTLVLALGTPVAVALAKGIADWIRKRGDPEIVIDGKRGKVVVSSGLSPEAKKEVILEAIRSGSI